MIGRISIMSLVEYQPYSPPIPEAFLVESKLDRPRIISARKIPFSEHTDFFRQAFQSGPDSVFRAYNPSPTFTSGGHSYVAVRVDCGEMTKSIIFEHTIRGLKPLTRTFELEDPYADNFGDELVFAGVQVFDKSFNNQGQPISNWRTILYRGRAISELEPFFIGPEGMKDIVPFKRPDGRIGVYTRPRSPGNEALGGDGQIGYREFESLDELGRSSPSSLDVRYAPLLPDFRFPTGEWGGVNHAQIVKDGEYQGWNLPLIHRAYRDTTRHYSAGARVHDPKTGRSVDLGIRITRSDLPPGPWKRQGESEDLKDVFYPKELILRGPTAIIRGGMSDAEAGEVEFPNPLLQLAA